MSSDPFEDTIEVLIDTKSDHSSMELILTTNTSMGYRPTLKDYIKSTPVTQILKWRSTLHGSFSTEIDGHKIIMLQDVNKAVHTVREANKLSIVWKFFNH